MLQHHLRLWDWSRPIFRLHKMFFREYFIFIRVYITLLVTFGLLIHRLHLYLALPTFLHHTSLPVLHLSIHTPYYSLIPPSIPSQDFSLSSSIRPILICSTLSHPFLNSDPFLNFSVHSSMQLESSWEAW